MRPHVAALALALLGGCERSSAEKDAGSPPPPSGCRDEAWRDEVLARGDAGASLDDAGRLELAADVEATLDPYGLSPLSALVTVRGVRPECVRSVTVTVRGLDGEDLDVALPYDQGYAVRYSCPEHLPDGGAAVQVPILGLYPDHANEVEIGVSESGAVHRAALEIATTPVSAWLPEVDVVTTERAAMEPGWNLASFMAAEGGFRARPFIYDHHGRIRWVLLVSEAVSPGFVTPLEPLRNGNMLLAIGDSVYEYSLLGREVGRWLLPDGFAQHHDVSEMPDGNLLVCGRADDAVIISGAGEELSPSDQVVEIDRTSGEVQNVWDLRRFLDVDRHAYTQTGVGQDWFHLNSVAYDAASDSIIVSGKHQGVAEITRGGAHPEDPLAGKVLRWILAPHQGWERADYDGTGPELGPFLLEAVDEGGTPLDESTQDGTASSPEFGWPYGQHAVLSLEDGSLFLFDNGGGRDLHTYAGEPFSRGVIYRIEPDVGGVGGTVQQVWEYGRERGAELYAPVISDVDVGPVTGNRFVMPGSFTTRPDGAPGGVAKMVEVLAADRRVVFEAHVLMRGDRAWYDDMCYRQERLPLYAGVGP